MSEIKWIKITTNIFDDEKIRLIDSMPDRDALIVIWFKLLTLTGKSNNNGLLTMSDKIPYTDEMLATIFNRPLNTVRLALETFETFSMIETLEHTIMIKNWEKHQSVEKLDKIRTQNRLRQQEYRNRQKQLSNNVTVTLHNALDIEEDKEEELEKEIDNINWKLLLETWNEKIPFKIRSISDTRKKHIKARLKNNSYDDLILCINKVSKSDFLLGKKTKFKATFDWVFGNEQNFNKILEDNYKNTKEEKPKEDKFDYSKYETVL